jgi:hypothetical protein
LQATVRPEKSTSGVLSLSFIGSVFYASLMSDVDYMPNGLQHSSRLDAGPLLREERTWIIRCLRPAFDPGCVKTCTSQECAELFSLSSSLSSGRKHSWFSNCRNRDGISTRRLNVGVFTRPRPTADLNRVRSVRDPIARAL